MKQVLLYTIIVSWVFLTTCDYNNHDPSKKVRIDLKGIKERGKLIAITNFNTVDYFIYRGQPMGYQFELLQDFAEYSGLKLEVIVNNDVQELFNKLLGGKCDLIAVNMQVTQDEKKFISFTEPMLQSRQVLVQLKPKSWQKLTQTEIDSQMIRSPLEMEGKTIVVQKNTAYVQRLKDIIEETGNKISIVEAPEDAEQLIQYVANGEIPYTVCDERLAEVNQKYYPQIDIETVLSFPQNMAWAVRKNSPELLAELNNWIEQFKKTNKYAIIYNKYFQNQWSAQMVNSDYFVLNSGRISPYDDQIKKYSRELNWDWRLLAAMMYQESNFNPSVKSWAGAYGLMQILPATAVRFGVNYAASPSLNIGVGVKLLKWLDKKLQETVSDEDERIKFVLAAYNIGIGHIIDAQKLAEKYHKNPALWKDVEYFLLSKSNPKYYLDPVVQFGYCRGTETTNYVSEILIRYRHYKNITVRY